MTLRRAPIADVIVGITRARPQTVQDWRILVSRQRPSPKAVAEFQLRGTTRVGNEPTERRGCPSYDRLLT